jgi:tetratricopeptide (TPR) repeat protein
MKQVTGHCPDLETIAAYLDGRLSERERAQVTEHLAGCETCYFVMTEAGQMASGPTLASEASPDSAKHRRWSRPVVWSSSMAGALATAAMVWLAVGGSWFTASPDSAALQALVAAVGSERTIEARLTGGFAYGPLGGEVRSGDGSPTSQSPDVRIAAAQIEKEASTDRSPQALHILGVSYLVTGNVGRAVAALEQAVDPANPDARTLSDLAAGYLVRGTRNKQPEDMAKGLAAADRALKADSRLAEASFNRALALEKLSLAGEARGAWGDYLKVDGRSEWATEARRHLQRLGVEER